MLHVALCCYHWTRTHFPKRLENWNYNCWMYMASWALTVELGNCVVVRPRENEWHYFNPLPLTKMFFYWKLKKKWLEGDLVRSLANHPLTIDQLKVCQQPTAPLWSVAMMDENWLSEGSVGFWRRIKRLTRKEWPPQHLYSPRTPRFLSS